MLAYNTAPMDATGTPAMTLLLAGVAGGRALSASGSVRQNLRTGRASNIIQTFSRLWRHLLRLPITIYLFVGIYAAILTRGYVICLRSLARALTQSYAFGNPIP